MAPILMELNYLDSCQINVMRKSSTLDRKINTLHSWSGYTRELRSI